MKLVSWNVNGLRAVWKKEFVDSFRRMNPDILAVQETKIQDHQLTEEMRNMPGYEAYWSHASVKKGYSGVGVYTRIPPLEVKFGIGIPKYDEEGRILELHFDDFIFFNIYFPNGGMGEDRLRYKLDFYKDFFAYLDEYKTAGKSLIITGDYNTAHNEIDLKNPKSNETTSGYMRVERDCLDRIVADGYVDTFRHLYPDRIRYSWWTYRFKARERNVGWRLDYFFTTLDLVESGRIQDALIDN
ncbi:MAG: exodeoxyribonuclease III, partial [Thermodesulfobacteriota bacterium]